MKRRAFLGFLGSGLLAVPLAVEAQPAGRVYRIGMLDRTPPAANAANLDGFRRGLRELGYVEEKNFIIEYRSADGRDERFAAQTATRSTAITHSYVARCPLRERSGKLCHYRFGKCLERFA